MPFRSEAQRKFLFAKHPEVAREFAAATPKGKETAEEGREEGAQVVLARAIAYLVGSLP